MNFTTDVLFSSVVEILQFKKTKTIDIAKSEKKDIIFGSISVFSSFNFVLQDSRSHNIYRKLLGFVDNKIPVEQAGYMSVRNLFYPMFYLFLVLASAYHTVWKKGLLYKLY